MTCDKDLIVGYVYDEIAPTDRARVEHHLTGCAACREEVDGFHATRRLLTVWAPPQPDLGFRMLDSRSRGAWRAWWTPAFGLAAAAVLVLAAAAAIANVRVTYGDVTLQTGWRTPAPVAASVTPAISADARLEAAYAAIERRVQELEAERASAPAAVAASAPARADRQSDDALLRRVHALLSTSETRQQQELALRVAQLARDFDLQRQSDLARIQQGLGRVESLTNAEAASHRQVMDILYRVTQQK